MQNLAGNTNCDALIRRELERSRIEVRELPARNQAEVPSSLIGKLGNFEFRRAWHYWVVTGPMPIGIAEDMFADPVGKTDIRVVGHCGCPPPEEPWNTWLTVDGCQVITVAQEAEWCRFVEKGIISASQKEKYIFSDDPVSVGARAYIMSYHIDTEVGLRLFADTIRKWHLGVV